MPKQLHSLVAELSNKTILVMGDVMLDEYITGKPTRMSREAPVPVLELESRRYIAGGSANPSANIVSLGSRAIQVGVIGEDDAGDRLKQILRDDGIDERGLVCSADRPTTVKTRILAQMGLRFPQQMTRIDTLTRRPINDDTASAILEFASGRIDSIDAVLLSHYHGGLLTPSLVTKLRQLCQSNGVLLTADAQGEFETFRGIDVIKCNAEDAQRFLNRELASDDDFSWAVQQLGEQLEIAKVTIITRGSQGATLTYDGDTCHCPAPEVSDVFDTVGAGDTAIATTTLALAAGFPARDAVMLANHASGIVVRHLGNYTPSPEELRQSIGDAL
ncbi:MAG: bifunctional ADP-heptose synthase [Chloroflexi bacterium]|nr:bifunctional ADP-heptose synthase [Chloroflexota bacterium]